MSKVKMQLNGESVVAEIEDRLSLADFIRDHQGLTGTHLACEHGVCGACTIEMNGSPVRSCITLALAAEGAGVKTIEGFDDDALMNILREAFSEAHGLQCGFCTPAMLITIRDMIVRDVCKTVDDIRIALAGNICRCTGYAGIVKAVQLASARYINLREKENA
jgi:aerobic carbon-monoxide dehydrogenase small subunit